MAERRAEPALVTEMASTIAALKEQLAGARNAALEEAAGVCQSLWEFFNANARSELGLAVDQARNRIRALASQPAAPTNLPAVRYYNKNGFQDADHVAFAAGAEFGCGMKHGMPCGPLHYSRAHAEQFVKDGSWLKDVQPAAPVQPEPLHAAVDIDSSPMMDFLAPPVQQPDDVREDILGAVARGWCAPENASKVMDEKLAFAIAREVQALATTRPGAALTALDLPKLTNIIQNAYVGESGEHLDAGPADAIARAILAASGGAEPVVPVKGAFLNNQGGVTLCKSGWERESHGFASMLFAAPAAPNQGGAQ